MSALVSDIKAWTCCHTTIVFRWNTCCHSSTPASLLRRCVCVRALRALPPGAHVRHGLACCAVSVCVQLLRVGETQLSASLLRSIALHPPVGHIALAFCGTAQHVRVIFRHSGRHPWSVRLTAHATPVCGSTQSIAASAPAETVRDLAVRMVDMVSAADAAGTTLHDKAATAWTR